MRNKEVKLLEHKKEDIVLMLKTAQKIFNIDNKLFLESETDEKEGLYIIDHKELTDQFYKRLMGMGAKAVNSYFSCPNPNFRTCVAWYNQTNDNRHNGGLKTPDDRFYCYIPDAIEGVILSRQINANKKYELISHMMLDLLKLKNIHEYKKSLFQKETA